MREPKFTDLLDDYLYYKAEWEKFRDGNPGYSPAGQDLYDRMGAAKQALNDIVSGRKE